MQRIVINKLGPIDYCDIELRDYTILTGAQASGKSTIAKSIFFFRAIKHHLSDRLRLMLIFDNDRLPHSIVDYAGDVITGLFFDVFGRRFPLDFQTSLTFYYDKELSVSVRVLDDNGHITVHISEILSDRLNAIGEQISDSINGVELDSLKEKIYSAFNDDVEVVYIPAGRSIITLLNSLWVYLFSSMNDAQRREIDYCNRSFLSEVIQLRSVYTRGVEEILSEAKAIEDDPGHLMRLELMKESVRHILQGEYKHIEGRDRLFLENGRELLINHASSGQQEVLWILNILFYYVCDLKKMCFIVEEPEAHLYPAAQKEIMEFIALAANGKNQIIITTHSPYVLGAINNLLFANRIADKLERSLVGKLIHPDKWISQERLSSFYISNGNTENCMDEEDGIIKQELIDGASEDINRVFDCLAELDEGQGDVS